MTEAGQRVAIAREGQAHRHRGRFDARFRLELRQQRRHERSRTRGICISGDRQRQTERRDAFGLEAGLNVLEQHEAADQQARPHQQHRRSGQLGDDENPSCARSARADSTAATQARKSVTRSSGYRERRHEPGRDAGEERHRHAEGQDIRVDRHFLQSRDRRRSEQHQRTHKRERDTCTCRPAEHPQDETLRQQLRDQLAPARAESGPHGHLAAPSLTSREQQIRHVRARDQQNERDGAEQGHQSWANAANHPLLQRNGRGRRVLFRLRKVHRQPVGRRLQRDGRLVRRHRVLQARQHLHPLRAACAGRKVTWLEDERLPEFRAGWKPQRGGSDSNNRHGKAVECRRHVHDVRTSAETAPPETVRNHDAILITLSVAFRKRAPNRHWHAHQPEVVRRDSRAWIRSGSPRPVMLAVMGATADTSANASFRST